VRIISATHRSLGDEVTGGKFRQDLYYRLNVIEVKMPALREMREDIGLLAAAILRRQSVSTPGRASRLSSAALERLTAYDFPGNVRELENVLERALALTTGEEIRAEDLQIAPTRVGAAAAPATLSGRPLPEQLDAVERQAILDALEQTRYNRTAAAKVLGITFRALRYRMERLGIKEELDSKG
jgi:two-component system response regulator PilR (NtrC family)